MAESSNHDILSYGFGRQMGQELARHPMNETDGINLQQVLQGLTDAFNGAPSAFTEEQVRAAYEEIQEKVKAALAEKQQAMIESGKTYLANNAQKSGVQTTESGLQYEILVEGNGDKPSASSVVKTHYHGCFPSGEVFDSSVQRGEPAEFAVNGVIAGWTEALQMMPVGSKWRLTVPSELAYGDRGAGGAIPPHATLVFEVELLEIVK